MSCLVELHNELIIPLGELLTNKVINTISFEAFMHTWEMISICINEFLVHPSHITDYGLLVQQHYLKNPVAVWCGTYSPLQSSSS